jgi:chromosome segregation ATPase
MAVMVPREKWTDERLDDLNKKVDDGFARRGGDIRELRREMNGRFDAIDGRFDKMNESTNARFDKTNESFNARFDSINARFDALNRNLLAGVAAVIAAVIGSNAF